MMKILFKKKKSRTSDVIKTKLTTQSGHLLFQEEASRLKVPKRFEKWK